MAGEIVIKCQQCGHKLVADAQFIGRKGRCPKCNAVIRLQRADDKHTDGTEGQVVALETLQTRKDALLRIQKQNDIGIIGFITSRILDQSNVQQLGEEFDSLVDQFHLGKMVLDFENVSYMSSAVMGKLVALLKKVKGSGGRLVLCNIEESIYEIFEIMRFDKMFEISPSVDEALDKLSS
jgi:anti-anti-sigma factor